MRPARACKGVNLPDRTDQVAMMGQMHNIVGKKLSVPSVNVGPCRKPRWYHGQKAMR